MTIRLRPELLARVRRTAKARDTSPNRVVVDALERLLGAGQADVFTQIHEVAQRGGIRLPKDGRIPFDRDELHEDDD